MQQQRESNDVTKASDVTAASNDDQQKTYSSEARRYSKDLKARLVTEHDVLMSSIRKIKAQEASRKDKLALRNALKLSSLLEADEPEVKHRKKDVGVKNMLDPPAGKRRRRERRTPERERKPREEECPPDDAIFIGPVIPAQLMSKPSKATPGGSDDECAITQVEAAGDAHDDVAVLITGENDIAKLSKYDAQYRCENADADDVMCVEEGELSDSGPETEQRTKRKLIDDVALEVTSSLECSDVEEEEDVLGKFSCNCRCRPHSAVVDTQRCSCLISQLSISYFSRYHLS